MQKGPVCKTRLAARARRPIDHCDFDTRGVQGPGRGHADHARANNQNPHDASVRLSFLVDMEYTEFMLRHLRLDSEETRWEPQSGRDG